MDAVEEGLAEFGELFTKFLRASLDAQGEKEPEFLTLLREHLGAAPDELPVVAEDVSAWDHANLQLALESVVGAESRSVRLVGVGGGRRYFKGLSFGDLVHTREATLGSVEYENLPVGPGKTHPCVKYGLALLDDAAGPAALLVRSIGQHGPRQGGGLQVEVMTPIDGLATSLLDELRGAMKALNVFRGQVVSMESTMWGAIQVVFHERASISRDDVILPAEVLADIERHTLGVGRRADALRASHRHLKRGLLLHGPPGTGKTHTVKWLTAELDSSTVIILSGGSLGIAGPVCRLARELAPAVVVLEDVDLVARDRMLPHGGGSLLFELLNELDGMADDADVAVVLTTNRPDLLEPALAARPGCVDLAVAIALPDAACRRRLFDLYARGLDLELEDTETVVERTDGVTASFFRELLRQATLDAAEAGSTTVRDEHVHAALDRLLDSAGALTRMLLGAVPGQRDASELPDSHSWLLRVEE